MQSNPIIADPFGVVPLTYAVRDRLDMPAMEQAVLLMLGNLV